MQSQLTFENLKSIASKFGTKVRFDRYRMWFSVPFIGNTALVVDNIVPGGGYRLIDCQSFPRKITPAYVEAAIANNAHSLGELDLNHNRCVFRNWEEKLGQYPPGYFTHRVGEESVA